MAFMATELDLIHVHATTASLSLLDVTCDQALLPSFITRGKEGVKHSFDGSHVKRTDSDFFS